MKSVRPLLSESPFKLDYELALAHPPQCPQRFIHLFHYYTAWTDGTPGCSSRTRVKEIHASPKFRLQMQILIAKYYKFKKVICLRSLTLTPTKEDKSAKLFFCQFLIQMGLKDLCKNTYVGQETLINSLQFSIQDKSKQTLLQVVGFDQRDYVGDMRLVSSGGEGVGHQRLAKKKPVKPNTHMTRRQL